SITSFSLLLPYSPPCCTLFPYTTLFRSHPLDDGAIDHDPALGREVVGEEDLDLAEADREEELSNKGPDGDSACAGVGRVDVLVADRKSTRLNSSHDQISYAVFCLKKKNY